MVLLCELKLEIENWIFPEKNFCFVLKIQEQDMHFLLLGRGYFLANTFLLLHENLFVLFFLHCNRLIEVTCLVLMGEHGSLCAVNDVVKVLIFAPCVEIDFFAKDVYFWTLKTILSLKKCCCYERHPN